MSNVHSSCIHLIPLISVRSSSIHRIVLKNPLGMEIFHPFTESNLHLFSMFHRVPQRTVRTNPGRMTRRGNICADGFLSFRSWTPSTSTSPGPCQRSWWPAVPRSKMMNLLWITYGLSMELSMELSMDYLWNYLWITTMDHLWITTMDYLWITTMDSLRETYGWLDDWMIVGCIHRWVSYAKNWYLWIDGPMDDGLDMDWIQYGSAMTDWLMDDRLMDCISLDTVLIDHPIHWSMDSLWREMDDESQKKESWIFIESIRHYLWMIYVRSFVLIHLIRCSSCKDYGDYC